MKSKEAKELALKVILADRTIKTQQLGMENIPNDNNKGFSLDELQRDQELEETEENQNKQVNEAEKKRNNFKNNILDKISIPRVKQVFIYIIEEAEFLIETDTIERCKNMTYEEKVPEYVESICRALNIKSEHELNQLLELFYKHNLNDKQEDKKDENEEDEGDSEGEEKEKNSNENDEIKIDPNEVLEILKEFYNEKKKKAQEKSKKNNILYLIFL